MRISDWSSDVCSSDLFLDRGLVKPPLFVQSIFGILGGIGADPENVLHMKRIADKLFGDAFHWSLLAAGRFQLPFVTLSATLGGNVRRSEEHTSELQSLMRISYAVFSLKKKKKKRQQQTSEPQNKTT